MTTARLTTAPVPRMATCGWLMIGVSKSAPRLPVLVSVKVPPDSSSGVILFGAGALGDVGDLARQPGDRQVAGLLDDRGQQPLLGVHRDRDVLAVEVGDLALLGVDRGVERRVLLERVDRRLREERHEAELHALASREVGLDRVAQPADRGHVDLDHRGELGADLERLDHPLGDDLAQPGQRLGLAAQRGRRDASGADAARRGAPARRRGRLAASRWPWRRRARPACGSARPRPSR